LKVYSKETIWDLETFLFKTQIVNVAGDFVEHRHEFSELFIVLEGTAMHRIASHIYPIRQGDVYIVKGDIPHAFLDTDGLQVCNISYDPRIFIGATGLLEEQTFEELFLREPAMRADMAYPSMLHLDRHTINQIVHLCDCCAEQYEQKKPGYVSCIRLCFLTMVSLLLQCYDFKKVLHPEGISILYHATQYMNEHFSEGISVKEIADFCHVSSRHLNRVFQQYYHISVSHHLQMLRLFKAAELLRQTELPIQEIAHACAFQDASYFTRCFRSKFDTTPHAFRGKYRV